MLNNEFNIHVCNSFIYNKFIKTRDAFINNKLALKNSHIRIHFYGIILIIFQTLTGIINIKLPKIVYVFKFFTSLIAYCKLLIKNYYYNFRQNRLKKKNNTFYLFIIYNKHSLIKNNTNN